MLFFKKDELKQDGVPKGFVAHEEIDSRKTSRLGYFFLLLMVIFGVAQGQGFLGALKDSISPPEGNSACFATLMQYSTDTQIRGNGGYAMYYGGKVIDPKACNFSQREVVAGIPEGYTSTYPKLVIEASLRKDLSDVNAQISKLSYSRSQAVDEYSVALIETVVQKNNGVLDQVSLKNSIKTSDDLKRSLESTRSDLDAKLNVVTGEIRGAVSQSTKRFTQVLDTYAYEMNVRELKQFALSVALVLPLFFFLWKRYSRSKNTRSEFALIWGGLLAISSLLLAQILLVFVYEILPYELIQKVFAFFASFKFFFVIIYWLGFMLVPLFFGWLIYLIQKKYYNKKAVQVRAFKVNKCPTCLMTVAPHMVFCPMCGTTLKVKCSSCGGYSPEAGDFCEVCGMRREENAVV